MGTYAVNHRYSSFRDGKRFGPYEPDTTVELEEADAEWVNRDSPGTLSELGADTPSDVHEEGTAGVEPDGGAAPVKDRAHRGGRRRPS